MAQASTIATELLAGIFARHPRRSAAAALQGRARATAARGALVEADLSGRRLDGGWFWNQDMRGVSLRSASARRAHFNGADLCGADLAGADVRKATFDGADLTDATLDRADLTLASLSGATLVTATLIGADLRAARLDGADLSGADLTGSDLRDVRHDEATSFVGAVFDATTRYAPDLDLEARGAVRITTVPGR